MVAPWSAPDALPVERAAPRATAGPASPAAPPAATGAGAPPGAPLITHPLTRFDIVDTALDIIKAAPRSVLGATALFLVPVEIVSTFVRRDQLDVSDINDAITGSWVIAVVLRFLALSFVTFAVAHLVWAWQHGSSPGPLAAASAALRRAPALVLAWVAVHLAEALAGVALAVPLLFMAPLLFATVPVIAIEGTGALAAMARSWRLGARDVSLAIGSFLVVTLVAFALMTGLSGVVYLSDALFDLFDISGAWLVQAGVRLATWLVVLPFVAAAATLHYLDLRVRREGLDIELGVERHFRAR